MSIRDIRYQAAVIEDGCLLLLRCVPHDGGALWVLPGGGREAGESEADCVAREIREEVGVDVSVGPVLYDIPADPADGTCARWRTYLCRVTGGEGWAALTAIRWLPLDDPASREPELRADPYLHQQLVRLRDAPRAAQPASASPAG